MHIDAIFGAIGRFAVRFRWLVVLVWIAAAFAAVTQLPSLASVTNNNNSTFLPASAPSERAAVLAAPLGTANLFGIPVVAARSGGPLTPADVTALTSLQHQLGTVPNVSRVQDLGRSPDGQAEQLQVLAQASGGNQSQQTDLINGLRAKIARADLPAGLQVHLAGDIAISVDQQKASGNTGGKVQDFSALFIIVLLVLIFRSLTLALTTLAPAFISVLISGPLVAEAAKHGLQVSPLAQFLLIVLVLGAGTDYGLFLVFRVREELRAGPHDTQGESYPGSRSAPGSMLRDLARARTPAAEAIIKSVTRVGESITFSAATVIAAVLTLLLASFTFYSDLGVPFAIAIGVTLVAALTLLPALLSIRLSLLAVKRTLFRTMFGRPKLLPWNIQGSGKSGVWGQVAGRIVRHPAPTLLAGLVVFGGLAVAVTGYKAAGFGGDVSPPAGSDSAAGQALLSKHFPQAAANPTSVIFRFGNPVWQDPQPLATATSKLRASGLFTQVIGPLNPAGAPITPAEYSALHAQLGPAKALPPVPPPGTTVPPALYEAYRATSNYVSPDGRIVQYSTGLKAGDPGGTAALDAVPAIRAATTATGQGDRRDRLGGRRRGARHLRHQQHLQQRPEASDPDRDRGDRPAAGDSAAQPGGPAVPDRFGRDLLPGGVRPLGAVVRRDRAQRRPGVLHAVPDVHLPAGARRGLQHPDDDPDPGGGTAYPATRRGHSRTGRHRNHDYLGRAGAGRHVRRVRDRGGQRRGRQPVPGYRRRPGAGHPDGHLPGPHAAGALHGGAARPVELVAVEDEPAQRAAARGGGARRRAGVRRRPARGPASRPAALTAPPPHPGIQARDRMPAHPTISVILPVYAVEEYLSDCLDSILDAAPARLEVIAVDDASPDGCAGILDARAEQDPRLRVVHLARNAGPGPARNAGLELATGDYAWFVDADDQLAPGALAAVAARLERDRPDVLLIDYEELGPGGRAAPSPGRGLLGAAPGGVFTLAGQPQMIHLTMTSWSKVVRRGFLAGAGARFGGGIHEDVPFTCAVLLRAERISALPRVCYRYRQARPGSLLGTASRAQLAIFRSYETVFALMAAADPAPPGAVSAAVFERAIWHYTTVLGGRGRAAGRAGPARRAAPAADRPGPARSATGVLRAHARGLRAVPPPRLPAPARGAGSKVPVGGAERLRAVQRPRAGQPAAGAAGRVAARAGEVGAREPGSSEEAVDRRVVACGTCSGSSWAW